MPASATYRVASPRASGSMELATRIAVADSGPMLR